ncbi:MAG: hypothetical protein Q8P41_27915 [Pseudomonadota bacterium]|nr:hypothetical protein [Pseudomonadota bacterium]
MHEVLPPGEMKGPRQAQPGGLRLWDGDPQLSPHVSPGRSQEV